MKEKILNALKTKYKNLGLSEKAFDGVAEFYSQTITDESNIEESIEHALPLFKVMQSESDKVRSDYQVKKIELEKQIEEMSAKLEKGTPPPNPPTGGDGDDNNAIKEIEDLKIKLQGLIDNQTQADKASKDEIFKQQVKERMINAGVQEKLCDIALANVNISENDTIEDVVNRGVEQFNFIKSELTPEAGDSQSSIIGDADTLMKNYFDKVKAEQVNNLKIKEDVINK